MKKTIKKSMKKKMALASIALAASCVVSKSGGNKNMRKQDGIEMMDISKT